MARSLSAVDVTVTYEAELGGAGNGWTDISRDVCAFPRPRWSWGTSGAGPTDLVARPGRFSFSLLNEANEQGQVGLYSPDRIEVRQGFGLGMAVRVKVVTQGLTRYKKYYLTGIAPATGSAGSRKTACVATDWMDIAMAHKLTGTAVQVDQRADQIFQTIVDAVSVTPDNTSKPTSSYIYPFALDRRAAHRYTAMHAFQELALSGLDRIFVARDETDGETVTLQDHSARFTTQQNVATFDGDGFELAASRTRDRVVNVVDCASPTRTRDAEGATTVLATIGDDRPIIAPSETVTIHLAYRDPNNEAQNVGITDMIAPVQTTDYAMESKGADVSGDFTVTATDEGTAVQVALENTGSTIATVTKLQVRGRGLYAYHDKHLRASDAASITAYGDRLLSIRLPWQADPNVCQAMANWIRDQRKDPETDVGAYRYTANRHADLAVASQRVEVGDRIAVRETVTGVSHMDGTGFWVNGISMESDAGLLRVGYMLERAEAFQDYFTLDTSALDGPDILSPF